MALSKYGNRLGMAAHQEHKELRAYVKSVQGYEHPRDLKLAQLCGLMGDKAYQEWYERNRFTSPVAKWEQLIDNEIRKYQEAELTHARHACPPACPLTASAIVSQGTAHPLGLAELAELAERRGYRVIRVERKAA